ncbi:MAG: GMC family oxidoreductase N-terminal domain-containing protein [Chitinophagaceae bacterium]|nr:GMC family oxidoreductase N-terminal domain-containing protein [Chitinophagaceae bacterium]
MNWPLDYNEIKPFYDRVDQLIGIFGTNEGLENDPDGIFLPPPKPRLHELFIKNAATQAGVRVIPSRLSILTQPLPGNSERGSCQFCAQCARNCSYYKADFSSPNVLIYPAMKTGNIDIISNAMAREVLTDREGLATGISYVSKEDNQEYQVSGSVVILAASACESARLLLNSKSQRHPNGLANNSNVVGKYLHDSTGAALGGYLPSPLLVVNVTMKTVWVVCTFIRPGGWITKNSISLVVITSNTGVEWDNLLMVSILALKT